MLWYGSPSKLIQHSNLFFSNDGDKLDLANSKQMWESSNELSLFGRNTQAIQIFLLLLPCPSPQAVVLNTGVCSLDFADTALSLFVGWL